MTLWFEDFPVGHRYRTGTTTLDEAAIVDFAQQHDPQPFHVDAQAAAELVYGGIIASGFQTLLTAFKLSLEGGSWAEASMGSPGIEDSALDPAGPARRRAACRGGGAEIHTVAVETRPRLHGYPHGCDQPDR